MVKARKLLESHVLLYSVTYILAVIGVVPLLTAMNEGMLVVPLAARPMEGVSFDQL